MWLVVLLVVVVIFVYFLRPSSIYRRKVLAEYRNWRGRALQPVDQDLKETLRSMKKQGLSPREARIVLCTYVDFGVLEAAKHLSAILAGETYQSPNAESAQPSSGASITTSTEPSSISSGGSRGPVRDADSFANVLYASLQNETMWNGSNLRGVPDSINKPPRLESEVRSLVFFAFDLAISSVKNRRVGRHLHESLLSLEESSGPHYDLTISRCRQYSGLFKPIANFDESCMALGKQFAEYVDNAGNVIVVTWAILTFKAIYADIRSKIDNFLEDPKK
jgi:hypothetical protein